VTERERLALFVPSLRGGGVERVMVTLANAFAAHGYPVDLVLAQVEGPYRTAVTAAVNVIDLRAPRVAVSIPGLVRYLRRARPDALLAAMEHTSIAALVATALAGVDCRVVISEHNHISSANGGHPGRKEMLTRRLRRALYPRADAVVAVSAGTADDLAHIARLDRAAVAVIHNPVTTPEIARLRREPVAHPWLNDPTRPVVMGIGRLTEQKDFSTLLRAFAHLRASRAARLIILGEGELRPALEAEVERLGLAGSVSLPGFVANPHAHVARAAVFALSSRREGFANVLVEAMACGTPVVATDCCSGPAEILANGAWGRLVPVGDAAALADALRATLAATAHPDVAARAAEFGVDRAVNAYLRMMLPQRFAARVHRHA
jgi:glycosyltransferase involved in cell wall biosynthesis